MKDKDWVLNPMSYARYVEKHIKTPAQITAFIDDIEAVCKKHNLSISHEDGHGAFEIDKYDEGNIHWLRDATLIHDSTLCT